MPTRRIGPDHQEAVSRRLAQLSAELAGVRPDLEIPTRARPPRPDPEPEVPPTHTRVSAARAPARAPDRAVPAPPAPAGWQEPEQPPVEPDPPPVLPPGRHAARRFGRSVADAVPDTVRGRFVLGWAQLALVAVLVAVSLAVTTWWVVRGDPEPVPAPVAAETVAGLATPAEPGVAAASAATAVARPGQPDGGRVVVDVAGKVRRPGIAVLDAGSRVVDALEAAGGARRGVDLTSLNLARLLVDGEQIVVGVPAAPAAGPVAAPAPGGAGPLVNINTADVAELETLPDVGPVTAEAIIAWRTEHGGFTAVDELLEVDGIGEATLETLSPHVTV